MRQIADACYLSVVGIGNIITKKTDQYCENDQRKDGLIIGIGE